MSMTKVEIEINDPILFTTDIPVRVSDLNYGNHLGHDSVLTIMQEARVMFYRALGFENELSFEGDVGQIIANATLQYKSEAFLGDVLVANVAVSNVTKVGFDMLYQLVNKVSGKEVARGRTGIYCFDFKKRRVVSIPEGLQKKIQQTFP